VLIVLFCYNNALPLANLNAISDRGITTAWLGTQTLAPVSVASNIAIAVDNVFNGVNTTFDVSKSGGATVGTDYSIAGGNITFKTLGTYTVEITNTGITSNVSFPAKVVATYVVNESPKISVTLADAGGNSLPASVAAGASVTFYKTASTESFDATWNGTAFVGALPLGSYIVGVENVAGYFSAYHDQVELSINATAVPLTAYGQVAPITVRLKAIPPLEEGTITLEGFIREDDELKGVHIKAKPRPNAAIRVYTNTQKKSDDDDDWTLIRTAVTDENGHYRLTGLPQGRYKIVPDLPGFTLESALIVEAQDNKSYIDLDFNIDTKTMTIIKVAEDVLSSAFEPETLPIAVTLYPNPFAGTLHLTGAEGCTLQVFTASGTVVHTQKVTHPDETISLEKLPSGVYFFHLEKGGKAKTVKAVKR
jgi:hypothetical protein